MEPFDTSQSNFHRSPLDDTKILSGAYWAELRVFLAVAKAKSFNRAAEELNTSQPTVSRQVKRLQHVLGSQLVLPTSSGTKLTDRGKELARALLALDKKLFEISYDLRLENKEAQGLVKISVTEGLAGLFVAPNLAKFSQKFPKISLHLRNPVNLTNLRENQTDIMIGFAAPTQGDVSFLALGHLHFIPVASRSYINSFGIPTRNTLPSHFFIESEYYSSNNGVWEQWRAAITQGTISHYCDNSFGYGLLVKSGLGIGLLGTFTLADPDFVPLELGVHVAVPIFILAMSERLSSKPVRLVHDWLVTIFGPANPWFAPELTFGALQRPEIPDPLSALISGLSDR